jgi:hypothetical protein
MERDDLQKLVSVVETELINLSATTSHFEDLTSKLPNVNLVKRLRKFMEYFDGQTVSGDLFGSTVDIILPKFTEIKVDESIRREDKLYRPDIFATTKENKRWVVEVSTSHKNSKDVIQQLKKYQSVLDATPWLVIDGKISSQIREEAN